MMLRQLKSLLMIPALVGILMLPAFSQEDMEVVDDGGFSNQQRPPAVFRHEDHNERAAIEDCSECHHIYEDGQKLEDDSSEDQSCSDCHDEKDEGNKPGLRKAFHTNCKGCHRQNKKGPVMCGECHVRS
jgi:Class III cytochrome C family